MQMVRNTRKFLSTLSLRRATQNVPLTETAVCDFYPRSPCGERRNSPHIPRKSQKFLSTLSLRRATLRIAGISASSAPFLSTLSLRRATSRSSSIYWQKESFLSTLSLRRATSSEKTLKRKGQNFYPRSPCGERPSKCAPISSSNSNFYPRSPCGERRKQITPRQITRRFLSTLSLRRATMPFFREGYKIKISIHALLAESDDSRRKAVLARDDFYPRSPCGERHLQVHRAALVIIFLSTLSLRRATHAKNHYSTHTTNFYPRSPCGERRIL